MTVPDNGTQYATNYRLTLEMLKELFYSTGANPGHLYTDKGLAQANLPSSSVFTGI